MKRYYLSNTERKLGGVCGGLAEYFEIDPTLVRVAFIVLFLAGCSGLLLYFLIWLVAPRA